MRFLNWLFRRTPTMDTPTFDPADLAASARPLPPKWQPATPSVAATPPEASVVELTDGLQLGDLHVAIEYVDAEGNASTRNITMQEIARGPYAPIVKAICHSRRAIRHFRTDRIVNIITSDGEVLTVEKFFRDVAHIDLRNVVPLSGREGLETARALRDFLRPAISLLVVAAKSDDQFHPTELAAIMNYVRAEAPFLAEYGKFTDAVGSAELAALEPMIRTMRPQERSVRNYLRTILSQRPERFARFREAMLQVVRADGIVALPEEVFLEDLDALRVAVELDNAAELTALGLSGEYEPAPRIDRSRVFDPHLHVRPGTPAHGDDW